MARHEKNENSVSLDIMIGMRDQALEIQDRLMSSDINVVTAAEKDLEQLLERFYHENDDIVAPQQYETARKDFGYFITLIAMAIVHYTQGNHIVH